MQESGTRVSLHQQVNLFLGLIEAGEARFLQRLLNLLFDMVVDIDLESKNKENCKYRDSHTKCFSLVFESFRPRLRVFLKEVNIAASSDGGA